MRKLTFMIVMVSLLLLSFIPFASAAVAPYDGSLTNYTARVGNDQLESFVNVPYSMENTGYPETLFYAILFSGVAFILFALWITSSPDYIASYTLIGCGVIISGLFSVLAYMAPLVCTHYMFTGIVPTTGVSGQITLNATNTLYNVLSVTYIFSPWVSYAMTGGVAIGILLTLAGVLSMYRTNNTKSIEQSIAQDGDPIYKGKSKRYEKE
jgi:hypothetical protein